MGWDVPSMYIESSFEGSDHWQFVAKPWNMFTGLEYSKAFLLGHGKYGKIPGWDPVTELRGFPDNQSKDLSKLIESYGDKIKDPTYMNLSELENIDLEKEIGMPEKGIEEMMLKNWDRYYNFRKKLKESDEFKGVDPKSFDKEELKEAIEKGKKNYENFILKVDRKKRKNYSSGFKDMLAFMREFCNEGKYDTFGRAEEQIRLVIWTH